MDFKGRAKFDAWAGKKGTSRDEAMQRYIAVVDRLHG
jgi:diazepam-binding inhibitor (GABA receptor modulating acyl-CoA-binding protein)